MADGVFIPTTRAYSIENLYSMDISSKEFKDFIVQLYQSINDISNVINVKDTGNYLTTETLCGQHYFEDPTLTSLTSGSPIRRSVYRTVVNFGTLPGSGTSGGTKSVAHGIPVDSTYTFTRIYGCATRPDIQVAIPLPFVHQASLVSCIQLYVTSTAVFVITGTNRSDYTRCFIVIEYIKS